MCDLYLCQMCNGDLTDATMHDRVCDQCYVSAWIDHAQREWLESLPTCRECRVVITQSRVDHYERLCHSCASLKPGLSGLS